MLLVFYRFFQLSSAHKNQLRFIHIISRNTQQRVYMLNAALHAQPYLLNWYEEQHG